MNIIKICPICKTEKQPEEFGPNKMTIDGIRYECKSCRKIWREQNKQRISEQQKFYRENNREEISVRRKQEYQENKEIIKARVNNYYHSNKEIISERNKEFRNNNKELIRRRKKEAYDKNKQDEFQKEQEYKNSLITVEFPPDYKVCIKCHTLKHEEQYNLRKGKKVKNPTRNTNCKSCQAEHHKEWRLENIDVLRAKGREKYHENPEKTKEKKRRSRQSEKYKLNQKTPENRIIRNQDQYVKKTLKQEDLKKDGSIALYFGCTKDFYRFHLKSQFQVNMDMNNYGNKLNNWSVDHHLPKEAFCILNKEEQDVVFHWTNCQPMWHTENEIKQDTMPDGTKARDTKHLFSLQDKKRLILKNLISKNLPYITEELLRKQDIFNDIIDEFFPALVFAT